MPKASKTNDFVFSDDDWFFVDENGEEIGGPVMEQLDSGEFDEEIDTDMSKSEVSLRPTSRKAHTTYVAADTPNEERRRMIIRVTLFAVIFLPIAVFLYPSSESFFLLSIMAFTFATNFAITIMTSNLEDKATSLELKTDTLLDELSSAASTLRNFQDNLENIDLEQLKENIDTARRDLEPIMERMANPSLTRIVSNVESLMDYMEDVDLEKIDKLLQNYKKGNDIQPIVQVNSNQEWDLLEQFPEEDFIDTNDDDFFPINADGISEDDDMFFP